MGMERQLEPVPKILYHCTRLDKVDTILKEGLKVNTPLSPVNKRVYNKKGVYLSTEMFGWMYWATDDHTHRGAVITINVEGLELIEDSDLLVISEADGEVKNRNLMDYICPNDIEPERIIAVSREQDDNSFVEERIR